MSKKYKRNPKQRSDKLNQGNPGDIYDRKDNIGNYSPITDTAIDIADAYTFGLVRGLMPDKFRGDRGRGR